jgi:hypothetical protein
MFRGVLGSNGPCFPSVRVLGVSEAGRLSSHIHNYIKRGIIKTPRGKTVFGEGPFRIEGVK